MSGPAGARELCSAELSRDGIRCPVPFFHGVDQGEVYSVAFRPNGKEMASAGASWNKLEERMARSRTVAQTGMCHGAFHYRVALAVAVGVFTRSSSFLNSGRSRIG